MHQNCDCVCHYSKNCGFTHPDRLKDYEERYAKLMANFITQNAVLAKAESRVRELREKIKAFADELTCFRVARGKNEKPCKLLPPNESYCANCFIQKEMREAGKE